tara:strand:+ start:31140 stop:31499 length:360 start_codon:yes stop_codon:yes gene_type:complete
MDVELIRRCKELHSAHHGTVLCANIRRMKLWVSAYEIRRQIAPHVQNGEVEILTELAYLSVLPAYRHISIVMHATVLQSLTSSSKNFFTCVVKLARRLDTHGMGDIATDADWLAWIDSM